ncbi:glycosyltransferase [Aneurinibacillus sp. Ricciae_BoGa-3]|uniref:glycosyltransferase n=1 Tax=Aneurinibacillus sp. Ricciae_BoGa-3 TaxID=3022697 RepID=UPI0023405699|nr:glycosyltransferase [Aneurinibacillus sp. Ricciae_BoGa-3]WCK55602.1 glycosyltransferase [Aneurinibacillus sp. Ricciae_BoGa-3]
MRKNILFISDHGDPLAKLGGVQSGGQNNYVRQLALALDRIGWRVDVVTHWSDEDTPRIEHFGDNCRVIRIEAGHKGFVSKNKMYTMLPAFYKEIKSSLSLKNYALVHTHYWLSGLLGQAIQKEYGIPFVHTSHSLGISKEMATGQRDEIRFAAERTVLSSAARIVATTVNEKSLIYEFAQAPSEVSVIPIGVASSFKPRFHRPQLRRSLGYNGPILVYAGRLEETKGIETLLKAMKIVCAREDVSPNLKLVLAGGQAEDIDPETKLPLPEKLRSLVMGIEDRVEFVGPKSQEELSVLFNAANLTVVPSYYESFGMVAAEAQACGSPVIASRVGGLQNVVMDGETGLLVEPKNPEDLALAIVALLNNDLLAQRMGKQAVELAKSDYQWPTISKRMAELYEEVLTAEQDDTSVGYGSGRDAGRRSGSFK